MRHGNGIAGALREVSIEEICRAILVEERQALQRLIWPGYPTRSLWVHVPHMSAKQFPWITILVKAANSRGVAENNPITLSLASLLEAAK